MMNSGIRLGYEAQRGDKLGMGLRKDYCMIGKQFMVHGNSKSTKICPVGTYYNSWKSLIKTEFSNGENTHVSMGNLKNVKNPLDEFEL